jgi:ribosomal protein L35
LSPEGYVTELKHYTPLHAARYCSIARITTPQPEQSHSIPTKSNRQHTATHKAEKTHRNLSKAFFQKKTPNQREDTEQDTIELSRTYRYLKKLNMNK